MNSLTNSPKSSQDQEKRNLIEHYLGQQIRDLLDHPDTIEVSLNSDGRLFVSLNNGEKMLVRDDADQIAAQMLMNAIAAWKAVTFNDKFPLISVELPTGERFSGQIPPVVPAPSFCIRKPSEKIITLEEYLHNGQINQHHYQIIVDAVKASRSMIILGGTASGKTTFANAVLQKISDTGDRLIIIEDLTELQCAAEDVLRLREAPPHVSMSDLVKQSLRLSPERIIIGEVRDRAALDLLKAWNTGHTGGIATIHANSAKDGISRLEQMILEAIPSVPHRLIESAVDLFIYIEKKAEKRYQVTQICEASITDGNWEFKEN